MASASFQNETMTSHPAASEALEFSARHLDKMMSVDNGAASLSERLGGGGVSGLHDRDYPSMIGHGPDSKALKLGVKVTRVPLPKELVENFGRMQCNCSMGLFTGLDRAWLTIDSDIYVWRYEDGGDLAFFDGLSDTILNVAMVKPKPGILQPHIVNLLALSTPVEISLLGVSFSGDEMQLVPEPLFTLSADQLHTSCIVGTCSGRIFLGGRDGHLYEFCYSGQDTWWGKKTNKVCHTSSSLSWILPGWFSLSEDDPIVQIVVDDTRNILYARSEKGNIMVFSLGSDGQGMERVALSSAQKMVEEASRLATTVETGNLKPIVHIDVVPVEEDSIIHLIAITGGGARLYLTTSNSASSGPCMLKLVHVRLPPGFSPSAPPQRPVKVHSGVTRSGLTVLASSPAEAADVLWVMSNSSMPPQQGIMMEGQTTVPVEGHAWAMHEVSSRNDFYDIMIASFGGRLPSASAIQHCCPARRLVVLSAHGAIIVEPGRPVDCLRQLLLDTGNPESEAVQTYWSLQGAEQATATALILATSQAVVERQIADWATRAFILNGGEPRLVYSGQPVPSQSMMSPVQPSFHPAIMSTPAQSYSPMNPMSSYHPHLSSHAPLPEVQFSARHNGLYLYLSRLLRPVWNFALLAPTNDLQSSLKLPQLSAVMAQLHDLRSWLEKNSSLCAGQEPRTGDTGAVFREKQSLMLLRQLIVDCLQMLGLWSVVVEHTLELVVSRLSQDMLRTLKQTQFRDLVVSPNGRDVAVKLVHCLVETYLNDSANTDAISNRLRQLCPSLYRHEDALSSKAHELLLAAAKLGNGSEKDKMIGEAVSIAIQIAGHLHLDVMVSHLTACQAYTRVVEVCLAAAAKRDPSQLAVHYYNSGENSEDTSGVAAYLARADAYKHCTDLLQTLMNAGTMTATSPKVPSTPGPPPPPSPVALSTGQASDWTDKVFKLMLSSPDQLLHVALYQWLIEKNFIDKLLSVKSQYLEEFLKRGTIQHPETHMFDLLWKYYEKNSEYVPAAKILSKLADRHSTELSLSGRVQYLSRAIMCVKSSDGGSANRAAGELLHHLEEKMEVARVQLLILEAVSAIPEAEGHTGKLNSDLLDITTLYKDWAEPFQLWECKLAILQCAGHADQPLVNTIWTQIIQNQENLNNGHNKIAALSNKIETLGRQYANSSKYFPLELIVKQLEIVSCKESADSRWVSASLQNAGVPLPRLLDVYNRLYTNKDAVWLTLGDRDNLHVLRVLCALLQSFAQDPSQVSVADRRQFTVVCQDAVSTYLGELYMKQTQETSSLVAKFRDIQAKLDRL